MSFHKIAVVGNAGQDAEMRYMPDGTPVVNFSLAVNERFAQGGERTTWYRVACWGSMTKAAMHVVKGQQVLIEGTPQVETWTDRNSGETRAQIKITAREFRFLGGRPDGSPAPVEGAEQTPEEIADEIPF